MAAQVSSVRVRWPVVAAGFSLRLWLRGGVDRPGSSPGLRGWQVVVPTSATSVAP